MTALTYAEGRNIPNGARLLEMARLLGQQTFAINTRDSSSDLFGSRVPYPARAKELLLLLLLFLLLTHPFQRPCAQTTG